MELICKARHSLFRPLAGYLPVSKKKKKQCVLWGEGERERWDAREVLAEARYYAVQCARTFAASGLSLRPMIC